MATLFLRNGRYYIHYMVHGERVRKSLGKDRREAEIYLKEVQYRLFKGDIQLERPQNTD